MCSIFVSMYSKQLFFLLFSFLRLFSSYFLYIIETKTLPGKRTSVKGMHKARANAEKVKTRMKKNKKTTETKDAMDEFLSHFFVTVLFFSSVCASVRGISEAVHSHLHHFSMAQYILVQTAGGHVPDLFKTAPTFLLRYINIFEDLTKPPSGHSGRTAASVTLTHVINMNMERDLQGK